MARKKVKEQKKEMTNAASTMQSNFRGYKTRKSISATKDQRERDLAFQRQLEYQTELQTTALEKKEKKEKEARKKKEQKEQKEQKEINNQNNSNSSTFVTQQTQQDEEESSTNNNGSTNNNDTTTTTTVAAMNEVMDIDAELETEELLEISKTTTTSVSNETKKKNNEDDDDYEEEEDMEWDDEDIAAALEGGSMQKTNVTEIDTKVKENEIVQAEPVVVEPPRESKFGPGRKKKKKKYY